MHSRQNNQNPTPAALPPMQHHINIAPPGYPSSSMQSTIPYVGERNGRTYKLIVEQQPVRARMCGFGDKDRRPITPPPCIKLVVCDAATGRELDVNEIDSTFFVLTVDLWDAEGTREVNLVRHSSGAPTVSISSSTITSYPPAPDRTAYLPGTPYGVVTDPYGRPIPPSYPVTTGGQQYYPSPGAPYPPGTGGVYPANSAAYPIAVAPPPSSTGMFTRNLIGSLAVNAFKLTDTQGKMGFWFVLQDLSVRTEGNFRLKMSFVDVGSGQNNGLNQGKAAVLATCFSDSFQVYSAKKFPGVIESTPLSKVFAGQGIKIPIRKDGGGKGLANQAEYDADE